MRKFILSMMKNTHWLLLLLTMSAVAQTHKQVLDDIVESEKKSGAKIMNVALNPNTYNYDVLYHKLELTFDLDNFTSLGGGNYETSISGIVTTDLKVTEPTSTIVFDMTNQLVVSAVTEDGAARSFVQNANNELVISFTGTLAENSLHTLKITYSGVPSGSGFGSFVADKHNNVPVIWTLSEPFGARDWWPCKQDLNDKVDQGIDVFITAQSAYTAVANGVQLSATTNGGLKTTHFHHGYPIPAYLIAVAITNYQVFNQQAGLGTPESPFFPIVNYSYPENATAIQNSVSVTPGIMNFYETKFGPYPFRDEKYGHCQFEWGGGMEHTTVSFMTKSNGSNNGYTRELIAHELGHQWFGDKVTCGSWRDIWLNEGFATYLAAIVIEEFDGADDFNSEKAGMIDWITSAPNGAVYLTEEEALNVNRIFNSRLTYRKGAMVIHMLRKKLGDTAFFQALTNYLTDPEHAYAYALTPDLKGHLEAASGQDLTEFFNDWIYNQGYPTYTVTAHNTTPGHATVNLAQTQSHSSVSFFEVNVPLRLFGAGGQQLDVVLDNTSNNQTFNLDVPFVVTAVAFDPNSDIISRDSEALLANKGFEAMTAVNLYPNPSRDRVNLDLPGGVNVQQTTITNTLGQTIAKTNAETSWNVSQWSNGIYLFQVQTDGGSKTVKFIKQ